MKKEMSNAARERLDAQKAVASGLTDRDTYTAKQVAMRCGTDAKTMRKFFRSDFSTVEAVGQGGRYEFDAADMPQIKKEFNAWLTRRTVKRPKPASELNTGKKPTPPPQHETPADVWEVDDSQVAEPDTTPHEDLALQHPDEEWGPTDDELLELEAELAGEGGEIQ